MTPCVHGCCCQAQLPPLVLLDVSLLDRSILLLIPRGCSDCCSQVPLLGAAEGRLPRTAGDGNHWRHCCHTASWILARPLANSVALDKQSHPSEPLFPLLYDGENDSEIRKTVASAKQSAWHVTTV